MPFNEKVKKLSERWGTAAFLTIAAIYLYLTLFLLPATPIFFEDDHFIQMYDSVRMMSGEVMYRNFFQFTFPGTEVWYLALFSLFGERIWLVNVTILLLGLSLSAAILAVSKKLIPGIYAYVAPALFLFFGFRWYGIDGGHRLFSCLFATLSILVIFEKTTWRRLVAAGALCAMAAMFTQTRGVAIFGAIGIYLIWLHFPYKTISRVKDLFSSAAIYSVSFAVTLCLLIGYFVATAGVSNFFRSTIGFAQNYNADPVNNSNLYFKFWLDLAAGTVNKASLPMDLFYYLLVPIVYAIPVVYYLVRKPRESQLWRKVMLLSVSGICLFLATTGLNSVRLYHVSIPGIILLCYWFQRSRWRLVPLIGMAVVIPAAFGLALWGQVKKYPSLVELPTGRVVFTSEMAGEKYVWLNDRTEPGDVVFEPYRTVVNFPLKLRNPTSFATLRDNNYTTQQQVEQILRELSANPPKYVLWDGNWTKVDTERKPDDHLRPLQDWLRSRYELRQALTPVFGIEIQVWEIKADGGATDLTK